METDLANLYSTSVKTRGSISIRSSGGSIPTQFERDPNLINLERNVFSQILDITKEETVPKPEYKSNNLRTVSYEEALKELLELEKGN